LRTTRDFGCLSGEGFDSSRMLPGLIAVDPTRELGKLLVLGGIALLVVGGFFALGGRLPFRLGRLPGDIAYQGKNGSFYFPIVTCIMLSVALTLILWVINLFRR
jgi:hypothetical protein